MPDYPSAASGFDARVKGGERPSAFDFIPSAYREDIRAAAVTDDLTSWIQDGLNSVAGVGGGVFYLPFGLYPVMDLDIPDSVLLAGDGKGKTILQRYGNLPAARGVLNLAGPHSGVRSLAIDGQVTTPVGSIYGAYSDPMHDDLTRNTSIWIAGGAEGIDIDDIRIFHTGGRAIMLDARTADIVRVMIGRSRFENNRPHLFGPSGSLIYGSWTGGIHYQGDGVDCAVSDLTIYDCHFRRGTGNQIHGHLYDFDRLHSDIKVKGCSFKDIGRDGVLIGGTSGGVVSDCHFRRIGYVCTNDASAGTPRWYNGQWAVGLDTAGLVSGVNYEGNTFLNCYGAAMDGDGHCESQVSGNTAKVSYPSEPEYTEDNLAAWTDNYSYGYQTSNSNNLERAATCVTVSGNTFINLGLGGVRMYAARKCSVRDNTIISPVVTTVNPIRLGNIGSGAYQRAYDNTVGGNTIHWDAASAAPAIFEDGSIAAFDPADKNWIAGNMVFGAYVYEFLKDADTISITGRMFSSKDSGITSRSDVFVQREESSGTGILRTYRNADTFKTLVDEIPIVVSLGPTVYGTAGPLYNVSLNAVGGIITTGPRTTTAWDDTMATGKLAADGFMMLSNGTFADFDADLMPDTYGLIRYDSTAKKFQLSTAVSAGARVWADLIASAAAAGSNKQVQFNNGGVFGASTNFTYDSALQRLTVTGLTGTAGIVAVDSYFQSTEGFLSLHTAPDTVNVPNGGVTALSLISVRNDGDMGLTLSRSSATARAYGLGISSGGVLLLRDVTAAANRLTVSTAGLFTFGSSVSINQTGDVSASGVVAAAGVNISGTAYNSLQVPAGGLYTGLGVTVDQSLYLKEFAAATMNNPAAGYGGLAYKSGTEFWIWDGAAWATIDMATVGGGVTSITGTANQVIASAATGAVVLSTPQNIHTGADVLFNTVSATAYINVANQSGDAFNSFRLDGSVDSLYVIARSDAGAAVGAGIYFRTAATGAGEVDRMWVSPVGKVFIAGFTDDSSGSAFQVTGFITASGGYSTSSTNTDSIKSTAGGVTAKYLIGTTSFTLAQETAGNAGLSGANQGRLYFDSTSKKFRVSENGGAYVDLITGSGVTSITGTANQVIASAATGAITLSLPQSIHTGATPTFSDLYLSNTLYLANNGGDPFVQTYLNSLSNQLRIILLSSPGAAAGSSFVLYTAPAGAGIVNRLYITETGKTYINYAGDDGSGSIFQVTGFGSSSTGWYTGSTSYQALQAPSGGVYTRSGHFEKYIHIAGNNGVPAATSGTSVPANGMFYYDTGLSKFQGYEGGAWKNLISVYTAGTGVSISGGNVISIGQAVATTSNVVFGSVNSSGAVQATATGAAIGFQLANSNFSVDGNGNLSLAASVNILGSYKTNGTTIVDSSRNATLATVTSAGVLQSTATGSSITFQNSNSNFSVDGNGNLSLAASVNILGAYKTNGTTVIDSSRNATFTTVSSAGAVQATATGAAIGFQLANSNFSVDGSGNVSSAASVNVLGSYKTNGTTIVDSSRNASFATVASAGAVQATATGASVGFQLANFNFSVNGNGDISGGGTINMIGGIRVNHNTVINSSRQFVGTGIDVGSGGISGGGYNVNGGYTGQTWNVVGSFTISGFPYTNLIFRGGVLVSAS